MKVFFKQNDNFSEAAKLLLIIRNIVYVFHIRNDGTKKFHDQEIVPSFFLFLMVALAAFCV